MEVPMPTYEYVCSKCEHHFETVQRITDQPLKICPKEFCHLKPWGKGKITRAISTGGGLIFKGSGFYSTDYRSDSYKADAKKEAGSTASAAPEGAKKDAKTSDSTPAKTPAPAPAPAPAKKPSPSEGG
jgi:putative FmdB family regulatory protein